MILPSFHETLAPAMFNPHLAEWFQFQNWPKLSWNSREWSQKRPSSRNTGVKISGCFRYSKTRGKGNRLSNRHMKGRCRSWRIIILRRWRKRRGGRISKSWLILKRRTLICNKIIGCLTHRLRWRMRTLQRNLDTHSKSNPSQSRECIQLWKMLNSGIKMSGLTKSSSESWSSMNRECISW